MALAVLGLVACNGAGVTDVATLCETVDEIIVIVGELGPDDPQHLEAGLLADRYQELAELNRQVAGALGDPDAAEHARELADILDAAAQTVAGFGDLRGQELVDRLEQSEATADMSRVVNANRPLGLNDAAMAEIEEHCEPDYSPLLPAPDGV